MFQDKYISKAQVLPVQPFRTESQGTSTTLGRHWVILKLVQLTHTNRVYTKEVQYLQNTESALEDH